MVKRGRVCWEHLLLCMVPKAILPHARSPARVLLLLPPSGSSFHPYRHPSLLRNLNSSWNHRRPK